MKINDKTSEALAHISQNLHAPSPERNRAQTLAKAAELKLKRQRDASDTMKEYEAARQEKQALTIKLRAERMAREAAAADAAGKKKR